MSKAHSVKTMLLAGFLLCTPLLARAQPLELLLVRAEGRARAASGDLAGARRAFRHALTIHQDPITCEELVLLRMQAGQYDQARAALRELSGRIGPERRQLFSNAIAGLDGRPIKVKVAVDTPARSNEAFLLALAAYAQGDPQAARAQFKASQLGIDTRPWEDDVADRYQFKIRYPGERPVECVLCKQPSAAYLIREQPTCAACRRKLSDAAVTHAWMHGSKSPLARKMTMLMGPPPDLSALDANRNASPQIANVGATRLTSYLPDALRATPLDSMRESDLVAAMLKDPKVAPFLGVHSQLERIKRLSANWTGPARWPLQIAYWNESLFEPASFTERQRQWGKARLLAEALTLLHPTALKHVDVAASMTKIQGGQLKLMEYRQFSNLLRQHPDDLYLHLILTGYLDVQEMLTYSPTKVQLKRWRIQHYPELSMLTGTPEDPRTVAALWPAWREQLARQPDKAEVLGSLAEFVQFQDQELQHALLLRCQKLQPDNTRWTLALRQYDEVQEVLSLKPDPEREQKRWEAAQVKLADPKTASLEDLSDGIQRAVQLDHREQAVGWSKRLLERTSLGKPDWNTGNLQYLAHQSLGEMAGRAGDFALAGQELLASARVPSSPQLSSFGPGVQLAGELLQRGQKDVVLEYLELCQALCPTRKVEFAHWAEQVRAGKQLDLKESAPRGVRTRGPGRPG